MSSPTLKPTPTPLVLNISSTTTHPATAANPAVVGGVAVVIGALCLCAVVMSICRYRDRQKARNRHHRAAKTDLEAQVVVRATQHIVVPPPRRSSSTTSSSTSSTGFGTSVVSGNGNGNGQGHGRGSNVKLTASSRLRDSVLCKAICQLPWMDSGKNKPAASIAVQAATVRYPKHPAAVHCRSDGPQPTPPTSERAAGVRPSRKRSQARTDRDRDRHETVCATTTSSTDPAPPLVVPQIVVTPPRAEDEHIRLSLSLVPPSPDARDSAQGEVVVDVSLPSVYSQDSFCGDVRDFNFSPQFAAERERERTPPLEFESDAGEHDVEGSPALETPGPLHAEFSFESGGGGGGGGAEEKRLSLSSGTASEVSFYFPGERSTRVWDYLQVPLMGWNGLAVDVGHGGGDGDFDFEDEDEEEEAVLVMTPTGSGTRPGESAGFGLGLSVHSDHEGAHGDQSGDSFREGCVDTRASGDSPYAHDGHGHGTTLAAPAPRYGWTLAQFKVNANFEVEPTDLDVNSSLHVNASADSSGYSSFSDQHDRPPSTRDAPYQYEHGRPLTTVFEDSREQSDRSCDSSISGSCLDSPATSVFDGRADIMRRDIQFTNKQHRERERGHDYNHGNRHAQYHHDSNHKHELTHYVHDSDAYVARPGNWNRF